MEDYQTITDKNGRTFTRRCRKVNYGANIFVRLVPETRRKFEELCNKENKNFSEKIRELIDNYIKENV